jgi:hypothetical protein
MPRKFIDGSGADSSTAAYAYLRQTPNPIVFTFVVIKLAKWLDSVNPPVGLPLTPSFFTTTFLLTNCPAAVKYNPLGTFRTSAIKHGAMPFGVGVAFNGFDVIWSPAASDIVQPPTGGGWNVTAPSINAIQAARHGFFDGAFISVYKVAMPTFYDANTYGACLLHCGCVDETKIEGGEITFKVGSIIDQQNQQVPSQLIGPNSRFSSLDPMAYVGVSQKVLGSGPDDAVRWANYQADPARPQSASLLTSFNYPDLFFTPPTGFFDGGFVVWTAGPLLGMRRPIAHSVSDLVNAIVTFYLAQPFPYDATLFSTGFAFGFSFDAYALRQPTTVESSGTYNGFPNIPAPEDAF